MLSPDSQSHKITRQLVYRATEASEVKGGWEKRIVELSDGKNIGEITEILYREEVKMGAWIVDIGLWKDIFDQSVIKTIRELTDTGYIYLKLDDSIQEGMNWQTSRWAKGK